MAPLSFAGILAQKNIYGLDLSQISRARSYEKEFNKLSNELKEVLTERKEIAESNIYTATLEIHKRLMQINIYKFEQEQFELLKKIISDSKTILSLSNKNNEPMSKEMEEAILSLTSSVNNLLNYAEEPSTLEKIGKASLLAVAALGLSGLALSSLAFSLSCIAALELYYYYTFPIGIIFDLAEAVILKSTPPLATLAVNLAAAPWGFVAQAAEKFNEILNNDARTLFRSNYYEEPELNNLLKNLVSTLPSQTIKNEIQEAMMVDLVVRGEKSVLNSIKQEYTNKFPQGIMKEATEGSVTLQFKREEYALEFFQQLTETESFIICNEDEIVLAISKGDGQLYKGYPSDETFRDTGSSLVKQENAPKLNDYTDRLLGIKFA